MSATTVQLTPKGRALADRLRAAAKFGESPQPAEETARSAAFASAHRINVVTSAAELREALAKKGGPKHAFVDSNDDGKCDTCGMPEKMHAAAAAETDALAADPPGGTEPCVDCGDPVVVEDATLVADAGASVTVDAGNPGRFRAVLAVEDERTADNRIIAKGATKWRTPPLPLMLMTKTADGHDGSEIAGVIETIARDGNKIVGEGRFDTGSAGLEAARLVANKVLTGVSIDAGDVEGAVEVEEADENGEPLSVLARMTALTILGATCVPFPAIASTSIEWMEPLASDTALSEDEAEAEVDEALTAAGPLTYPQALFTDPQFERPTPLRVEQTDDPDVWHVSGHAARWGQCHIGFPNTCVTPPKTRTNYSHFRTGSVALAEGGLQPIGTITLDTNHPTDRPYSAREAAAHYDHTGTAAAFVNVGEDEHGIWVAGVLKPGLDEACATVLAASSLSGDWRRIGGNLELVALLSVNTPGYPVAFTEGDEQVALVAAGYGAVKPVKSHLVLAREAQHAAQSALERVERQETVIAALREEVSALARIVAPIARERIQNRLTPARIEGNATATTTVLLSADGAGNFTVNGQKVLVEETDELNGPPPAS